MNLHSDVLHIPRKLHYLICGRKRVTLQPIVDETLINIYFPSPFPILDTIAIQSNNNVDDEGDTDTTDDEPPIFITGDAANVSRVKDMLTKLANQKVKAGSSEGHFYLQATPQTHARILLAVMLGVGQINVP